MITSKTKFDRILSILFPFVFILLTAVLLWKCRYGFPYEESFYAVTAYRFATGDLPLIHEWHLSQLCFIYLAPAVGGFLKAAGGTEGIFLFLRILYTVTWALFALFTWFRLRKISNTGAVAVSLAVLMYAPAGQMAICYNTVGVMMLLMSCVIVITAERFRKAQFVIAGILYAVAVTCCPYLAVLFIACVVFAVMEMVRRKEKEWLFFVLGVMVMFALSLIFFLTRAPLGKYLEILPKILNDSEHQGSFIGKAGDYFLAVIQSTIPTAIILVMAAGTAAYCGYKKSEKSKTAGFVITCVLTMLLFLSFKIQNNLINYYTFIPAVLGIISLICLNDELNKKLFIFMWVPGVVYSLCLHMSSNMRFVAISTAMTVASAASIIMAARYAEAMKQGKAGIIALAAVMILTFGCIAERRIVYVFGDNNFIYDTEYIDHGVAKGLYVTPEWKEIYDSKCADIAPVKNSSRERKVFILSSEIWLYLEVDKEIAAPTTWTSVLSPGLLDDYYGTHPDRRPDVIYLDGTYSGLADQFKLQYYDGEKTSEDAYILYPAS